MPSSPGETETPAAPLPKVTPEENDAQEAASNVETPDKAASPTEEAPPLPEEPAPEGPPLPEEPTPEEPPLPSEPVPQPADDGWDCQWDPNTQAWFFHNRFTGKTQWDNPRVPEASGASASAAPAAAQGGDNTDAPLPPASEKPAVGGYNPAIHGDYDPNAWYAKGYNEEDEEQADAAAQLDADGAYGATATFNRFTGQFQTADMGPGRHSDEAKSKRQMNAFFDVDAAANAHDGRSLKAERSNKKPSKSELKAFKEKRRARKEEKRRAWLRD